MTTGPSTTQTLNSNTIAIPMPPASTGLDTKDEMEIYARFMRHLRHVPNSRADIKILSAIQFTADMLNYSDAHVAKVLVELGLRAPRMAFPAEFLTYTDSALLRPRWAVGGPSEALLGLQSHWQTIGEDKFAAFKRDFDLVDEQAYL